MNTFIKTQRRVVHFAVCKLYLKNKLKCESSACESNRELGKSGWPRGLIPQARVCGSSSRERVGRAGRKQPHLALCGQAWPREWKRAVPLTAGTEAAGSGPPPGSSEATLELRPPPRPALRAEARWRLGRDQPV